MSLIELLWVFVLTWVCACAFYFWKANRLVRGNGLSIFGAFSRQSRTSRTIVRRLLINLVIATILLLTLIAFAWSINQ